MTINLTGGAALFRTVVAAGALLMSVSAFAGLNIQRWQTPQGAQVIFVESHEIPMLDVSVDFPAGSAYDPDGQSGLASLTHGLLDQGAGGLTDTEIAHRLADVGAILGGRFDQDRAGVSLRTLSSAHEKEAALDVMARVLQTPDFTAAIVAREKKRVLSALKEAEAQPDEVAGKAFNRAVFGTHPYARPEMGEADVIPRLMRADLAAFHRSHYTASNAVIALMGDISRSDAEALALRLTAKLPKGSVQKPLSKPLPTFPHETRVPFPSAQSHVLIGSVGVSRDDPDFFPLYVGNYVLGGGGFDSRLLKEVRDKRGYAYSAYSYFMPMAVPGTFMLGLQTKSVQTDDALKVARDTLRQFVAEGPSEAELTQAKNNLTGGFPLRIDSNKKILEYLGLISFYKLPVDYLDTWVAKVDAVDVATVKQAFARRVNPDQMATVVVGTASAKP
jgi:zinc protease